MQKAFHALSHDFTKAYLRILSLEAEYHDFQAKAGE